jgi:predicted acetyltransferase
MDGLCVRPARQSDLEQLAEIHACAYPEPGGHEHHARCLTHNSFGGLDRVRVAEKNGEIAACAALYSLELWLGGRRVPTGGIGSLAVAPEVRRQGVSRALLEELHKEIESEQGAFALLYPFEQRFYARRGYAAVSPLLTLKIASEAIDTAPSFGAGAEAFSMVRLEGPRVEEARALYDAMAERTSGRVVRSQSRWMKLFGREDRHWMGAASREGKLGGYVSFSYEGGPMSRDQTLVVEELTSGGGAATQALFRALGRQRDQIADIQITVPWQDPLVLVFEDAAGARRGPDGVSHPLGTVSAGPMVRMIDVRRALSLRGYAADGDLTFVYTDGGLRESVRLTVHGGTARTLEGGVSPEIELSRGTLGSIVACGMRPTEAAELGLLRASAQALEAAEQMFSGPRFQCFDPF